MPLENDNSSFSFGDTINLLCPQKLTAFFRCDGGARIGTGHVMRCLTLADFLAAQGWSCSFVVSEETPKAVPALSGRGYPVLIEGTPAARACRGDLIVVDHYGLDVTYERALRSRFSKILVIDDLADRAHDCDFLLDQTYGRDPGDYKSLVPDHCKRLCGAEYALLRPEFAALRRESLARRDAQNSKVERILISFGGADPDNVTGAALSAIMAAKMSSPPSIDIDVVAGSANLHFEALEAQAAQMAPHRVTLHRHVGDMARMMADADLAIGAGGTTSWERCCLGLPALLVEIADNQRFVAQALAQAGAVVSAGRADAPDFGAFSVLLSSPEKVRRMQAAAQGVCDGRGAARVLPILLPCVPDMPEEVRFRLLEPADCAQVFEWQCLPETRRYAHTPDAPSWDGHQAWFARRVSLPPDTALDFMIESPSEGTPLGVLRLDRGCAPGGRDEISIYLAPEAKGRGVGVATLSALRRLIPSGQFYAVIHPENIASRRVFEKCGFSLYNGAGTAQPDAPFQAFVSDPAEK